MGLEKGEQVAKWDYRSCWMHHYVEQENSWTSRFYSFVVFIISLLQTILIQTSQLVDFKELKGLKAKSCDWCS